MENWTINIMNIKKTGSTFYVDIVTEIVLIVPFCRYFLRLAVYPPKLDKEGRRIIIFRPGTV